MTTPAFQANAFQNNAFQSGVFVNPRNITDTTQLQLPINAVLGDGTPRIDRKRASPLEALSGVMRSIFRE